MTVGASIERRIVDAALDLATESGWSGVTLPLIAERLGEPLSAVYAPFRDMNAVADAWIAGADDQLLRAAERAEESGLTASDRLHAAIMAWLQALDGRRDIMREILCYKLKPPHLHLQVDFVTATSSRIQMLREACRLQAPGLLKSVQEIGLTALFSATVLYWVNDGGKDDERTAAFLQQQLERAQRVLGPLN